ncbi:hypothetical protein HRG84_24085 [Flavisolibacter sp. BT320]|nr:hypothetical protein [Flavisolibacter longurius]
MAELQAATKVVFHPEVSAKSRLHDFFKHAHLLKTDVYWYALRLAYEMGQVRQYHLRLLKEKLVGNTTCLAMMEKREVALFAQLPAIVTLYKVLTPHQWERGRYDFSWYLRPQVAFAPPEPRRKPQARGAQLLYSIRVEKRSIVALLNNKRQGEALINPYG